MAASPQILENLDRTYPDYIEKKLPEDVLDR
jgi:hypothetical protein